MLSKSQREKPFEKDVTVLAVDINAPGVGPKKKKIGQEKVIISTFRRIGGCLDGYIGIYGTQTPPPSWGLDYRFTRMVSHNPALIFSCDVRFSMSPRTSHELLTNYSSTKMCNVIRSFIYLFFHFASALPGDCGNPSIRSEGRGLMTLCII